MLPSSARAFPTQVVSVTTSDGAQRQQRPRPAERIADRFVLGDRLHEQGQRVLDVPARCRDEAAAARHVREYPLAGDTCGVRLPDIDDPVRVVEPAELEEQLGVVSAPPADARLAPSELRGAAVGLAEPLRGCGRISAPGGDES